MDVANACMWLLKFVLASHKPTINQQARGYQEKLVIGEGRRRLDYGSRGHSSPTHKEAASGTKGCHNRQKET